MQILLYIGAIALVGFAQMQVQGAFRKYSQIETMAGRTGADVARAILAGKGITDVEIIPSAGGVLSDNFNPTTKKISLSQGIYDGSTIASVAVAAHEVGHAIQYHEGYKIIGLRNKILPLAITAGNLSIGILMAGLLFQMTGLLYVGIALFSVTALFQLVTLPLEFDASKRALQILSTDGYVQGSEAEGAKKMLTAAALTYIAAFISTIMQILQYIFMANNRNNKR